MQFAGRKRGVVLFAQTVLTAFATLSCGEETAEPLAEGMPFADGIPPLCQPYEDDAELFGYCLYSLAGGMPSEQEMQRLCALSGDWEGECRHAWVAGRMKEDDVELEYLLDVCGDNPDCSFEVLDFRPDPDIEVQLDRCRRYTGPHHADCAGHALQRWYGQSPDAAEVLRVSQLQTGYPDKVGWWVGVNVECWGLGNCEDATPGTPGNMGNREYCESAVQTMTENRDQCPARLPRNMHQSGQQDPRRPR